MLKVFRQARAAVSLLNPAEVRRQARLPVHIGLVSADSEGYAEMERFLVPNGGPRDQVHRASDPDVPETVDFVLYQTGVANPEGTYSFDPNNPRSWIGPILEDRDDSGIAMARQFPAFRAAVVEHTIHKVARENAMFALATALPNVVPNLVQLPWAIGEFASDTAFITGNQIRMAFVIATACGRDAGFSEQKAAILSIAGGAFGWRALARELIGKIPLGGGLIPKGAIAYAGTYLVGKGLEMYYLGNKRFTRAQQKEVYKEAYERGRGISEELSKRSA
jgi:hypothetical protein